MIAAVKPGGRVPPQDLESERAALGSVMLQNDAFYEVSELIASTDFSSRAHRLVFEAMTALAHRGEPIDVITLQVELRNRGHLDAVGGAAGLISLAEAVATAANATYYAGVVREKAILRQLGAVGTSIVASTEDGTAAADALDRAEASILGIARPNNRTTLEHVAPLVSATYAKVEQLHDRGDVVTGLATGLVDLDNITAGLQPTDLIIIAGRPSMGKTALALNIGVHVAVRGGGVVAVFSCEMSSEQLMFRAMAAEARIDLARVRVGRIADAEFERLAAAGSRIAASGLHFDETAAATVMEVRAKARRLKAQKGLALVIVDYLQLMRGVGDNREQEVSSCGRGLKALAKELAVPVIALAQLNRSLEQRADKRPILADLRESGGLEQDADVVAFVYRDEVYNPDTNDRGIAELILRKHRNGAPGTVRLAWSDAHTRFDNLAEGR